MLYSLHMQKNCPCWVLSGSLQSCDNFVCLFLVVRLITRHGSRIYRPGGIWWCGCVVPCWCWCGCVVIWSLIYPLKAKLRYSLPRLCHISVMVTSHLAEYKKLWHMICMINISVAGMCWTEFYIDFLMVILFIYI